MNKIDFDRFAQQNRLTYNDSHTLIYVKPTSKYDFVTYPLEDLAGTVAITMEEYLGLRTRYYMFNDNLNMVVLYEEPVEEEETPIDVLDEE